VRHSEQIRQFFLNIFILDISFGILQAFIQFAFAAKMNNLEILEKLGKNCSDSLVYGSGSKTAAYDKDHWLIRTESCKFQACFSASCKELLPDRSSGEYSCVCRKLRNCFRKIAADLCGKRNAYFVG